MKPLDSVYWDPVGAAVGFLVLGVLAAAWIARMRWNLNTTSADTFVVDRSTAIRRLQAGPANLLRTHVRWRKPEWDSEWWMTANVSLSADELLIIPNRFAGIELASPGRPIFRAYIVPRHRITKANWVRNEVWPAWRSGLGSQLVAISTDANATCYIGSSRTEDLVPLLQALAV